MPNPGVALRRDVAAAYDQHAAYKRCARLERGLLTESSQSVTFYKFIFLN
jgi:hypothetical protein